MRRWVDTRIAGLPAHASGEIVYEIDVAPRSVTIVECRPPWNEEFGPEWTRFPIARLRYTKARREWALYWRDRNSDFHSYDLTQPTPNVDELLAEVDRDPTNIFWG